jgi:hypothetical protein
MLFFSLTSLLAADCVYGDGMAVYSPTSLFTTWLTRDLDRPVNAVGERVTPSDLAAHRLTHRFLGPCCICPAIIEGGTAFTEAAFVMTLSGRRFGQYVARCANGTCKYFSESSTAIAGWSRQLIPV